MGMKVLESIQQANRQMYKNAIDNVCHPDMNPDRCKSCLPTNCRFNCPDEESRGKNMTAMCTEICSFAKEDPPIVTPKPLCAGMVENTVTSADAYDIEPDWIPRVCKQFQHVTVPPHEPCLIKGPAGECVSNSSNSICSDKSQAECEKLNVCHWQEGQSPESMVRSSCYSMVKLLYDEWNWPLAQDQTQCQTVCTEKFANSSEKQKACFLGCGLDPNPGPNSGSAPAMSRKQFGSQLAQN